MSSNLITNVNPLVNLEGVTWDFRLNDNSLRTLNLSNNNISNLDQLFNLNNFVHLNLSNNNITSIYWIRQKNNLDYLNISWNPNITDLSYLNYSSSSKTLQLDTRNYSVKINSVSICNNRTILDQNATTYPNKSLICN